MAGQGFFSDVAPIRYEGSQSANPLAFRRRDCGKPAPGKRMADLPRTAICYWRSFADPGLDPFGGDMATARLEPDVAFKTFDLLGFSVFALRDRDNAPKGDSKGGAA